MEYFISDGSETGRKIPLELDVTEVGSEWGGLHLGKHCRV